jgi:hypothetical protein
VDRYSFDVKLFHLLLSAGLSRRTMRATRRVSVARIRNLALDEGAVIVFESAPKRGWGTMALIWRLITPRGFRVEGLDEKSLVALLRALG